MKQLLESGVHFGHQTRKWNPKMKKYIFTARNDIHIINLEQTSEQVDKAYKFIRDVVASGKNILFVGTKKTSTRCSKGRSRKMRHVLHQYTLAWRLLDKLQDNQIKN